MHSHFFLSSGYRKITNYHESYEQPKCLQLSLNLMATLMEKPKSGNLSGMCWWASFLNPLGLKATVWRTGAERIGSSSKRTKIQRCLQIRGNIVLRMMFTLPPPPLLLPPLLLLHHNLLLLLVPLHRHPPHPQGSQHHQPSCLASHRTT